MKRVSKSEVSSAKRLQQRWCHVAWNDAPVSTKTTITLKVCVNRNIQAGVVLALNGINALGNAQNSIARVVFVFYSARNMVNRVEFRCGNTKKEII